MTDRPFDSFLLLSFGGPEKLEDVLPFLQNVLRGRNVPEERMREVAHHYELFGGRSPINDQNRALIAALGAELHGKGPDLPVYWGNRNWHPLLADTLRQMAAEGRRRALALVTSAYSSYSGCRQYREDVERARGEVGAAAPEVEKLRAFFNHPGFVEANADAVRAALSELPQARLVFTAHSVPVSMAAGSDYEAQLGEVARLVAEAVGRVEWDLAYQSRSGPPGQPWLEPDVKDHLTALQARGVTEVALAPVGFVSDHMEVVYDLDTDARQHCESIGIRMVRAATAGRHPAFVSMIRELVLERTGGAPRRALGRLGPRSDSCPADCCPAPAGRPRPPS
ncbi:MAG TPA: ferrochelatase [Candidatus Polarisedimenticolaceae bacterium]|nr:ferrochelatase [Candidatus Polarisedimenticolaceae bacterium]